MEMALLEHTRTSAHRAIGFKISKTCSTYKHAAELRLSDRTKRQILHKDLFFHQHKIMNIQECDYRSRIVTCVGMIKTLSNAPNDFFSDDAHFHLSDCVNKQNVRYQSEKYLQGIHLWDFCVVPVSQCGMQYHKRKLLHLLVHSIRQ